MKAVFAVAVAALAALLLSQPAPRIQPGPQPDESTLLVTGWRVKPAGRQVPLDTLPMSTALAPDGKHLIVLNGGYRPPSLSVLETETMREVSRRGVPDAWLGLTFSKDGKLVYAGGGARGAVYEFRFTGQATLEPARTLQIIPEGQLGPKYFIGDVVIGPEGRLLYAASLFEDAIHVINLQSGRVIEKWPTGRRPYRILFHPDGKSYFVTSWLDGALHHHDATSGALLATMRLGPHASDMVWRDSRPEELKDEERAPWKARIFVAAANTNSVYTVGVSESKELRRLESINVAMTPRQPLGMTPSALALDRDQRRLLIACSDANAVAVADVARDYSRVLGFLPTGWYPTAVRVLPDGRTVVLNGKGLRSFPNPRGPSPQRRPAPEGRGIEAPEFVARIQTGSASIIDPFTDEQLAAHSQTVFRNSPYTDGLLDLVPTGEGNPVPSRPGEPSPIEHVIYIVKENRTYDQVLGDLDKGNGDPSLVLFGEDSAPNHRKLAREFVLFDNFYVNADVSADGHNWSAAAIANDFVQKLWPSTYAKRRQLNDYQLTEPTSLAPAGYIWSNAIAAGVTVRNYGWFVDNLPQPAAGGPQVAKVRDPALAKFTNLNFRGFDLGYPDVERAKVFLQDLAQFEAAGSMPKLLLVRLGNDHTSGTTPGRVAPHSAMADNDYGLGMIVEAVSKSRFWPKTAIFVLEDDAQNGPDHVDSHRSPAYILSPYTRRGIVDSNFYNTTSMLRTIELIVGLRPMTHYDAGSRPMAPAFAAKPDPRPYEAEKPRIPLDRLNAAASETAARSARLDLSEADRIDDDEMNEILWRAIRGTEPPAPVRSYFSR